MRRSVVRPKLVSKKWTRGRRISRSSIDWMIKVRKVLLRETHYAFLTTTCQPAVERCVNGAKTICDGRRSNLTRSGRTGKRLTQFSYRPQCFLRYASSNNVRIGLLLFKLRNIYAS